MENRENGERGIRPSPEGDIDRIGSVELRRWFSSERSAILTAGDFSDFLSAWRSHAQLWDGGYDGLAETLMRQGLAAATLYLANRPRDETVAWTLNLKEPPTNLFLTGEARRGIVTGRVFSENVRTSDSSRLYVQTLRARGEPIMSAIEVTGFDVLEIFEQYYERSEQSPARFLEIHGHGDRFAMVLGMPGADRGWIAGIGPEDIGVPAGSPGRSPGGPPGGSSDASSDGSRDGPGARPSRRSFNGSSRLLEERTMRFECGCTPRKMLRALRGIFGEKPEELFQGDVSVETACPRCGRRWRVSREQFDAAAAAGDPDVR